MQENKDLLRSQLEGYVGSHQLYESQKTVVYRGQRLSDGQPVILKLLNSDDPPHQEMLRFQREFDLVKTFQTPGVVQALEIKPFLNSRIIVFEDIGGISLDRMVAAGPLNLAEFFQLAIQLSETVGILHRQKIVHKDITPANVVWNSTERRGQLIDFGIATQLLRENTVLVNSSPLEGSLPYLSPEQTGRMNRVIDHRTDLYSLGATLYHLLTGHPLFSVKDPLELIYCHLTKLPLTPFHRKPHLPLAVSKIIMKLVEKNAEDRYQSAFGVKADLLMCDQQFQSIGHIAVFPLGQSDISDQFQIPQKLYGREVEIAHLYAAFDRVSQGTSELVLVAGPSGIGKSILVKELQRPIVQKRGLFISGKCDPFSSNVPYVSLIQAFRGLIRQLLSYDQQEVASWKHKLLAVLGSNGQIIIEVIPEVELILGPQPPPPELPPNESQNRFDLVFQKFTEAFAIYNHPLVIFLDDLQWADSSSLHLIEQVMSNAQGQPLLMIGAYRSDEVDRSDPLYLCLENIAQASTPIKTIPLLPLELAHVGELISETLDCDKEQTQLLAQLCFEKTQGNPFFLHQFLQNLHHEKLIFFDYEQGSWQWKWEAIQAKQYTDNVIAFMIAKIQTFASSTQTALQTASCVGKAFETNLLAHVMECTETWIEEQLREVLKDGLLFQQGTRYSFVHDRVQQAAATLLPDKEQQQIHFKIGSYLLQSLSEKEQEPHIIDMVNHLNHGAHYTKTNLSIEVLARLNLKAGKKSRFSNAYDAAANYFRWGIHWLEEARWQSHHDLLFSLTFGLAEAEYLLRHHESANQQFDNLYQYAQTPNTQVEILATQVLLLMDVGKHQEATALFRKAMVLCEEPIPKDEEAVQNALSLEKNAVLALIGGRAIAELIDLPEMTDSLSLMKMKLLVNIIPAAYFTDLTLHRWLGFRILRLTIEHGNSPYASFGYSIAAFVMRSAFGDTPTGYEFGLLAVKNSDKYGDPNYQCKTYTLMGLTINHWSQPLSDNIPYAKKGIRYGMDSGDYLHTGTAISAVLLALSTSGVSLNTVKEACEQHWPFLQKKAPEIAPYADILSAFVDYLTGRRLDNNPLFDGEFCSRLESNQFKVPLLTYYTRKMMLSLLFQQWDEGEQQIQQAEACLPYASGQIEEQDYHFLKALLYAASYLEGVDSQQSSEIVLGEIQLAVEILERWNRDCPENFQHKLYLIRAFVYRIKNQFVRAAECFDWAIESALQHGFTHNAAIANESAGNYYRSLGRQKMARMYFQEASVLFLKWGATFKVHQLQANHPQFLSHPHTTASFNKEAPITWTFSTASGSIIDLMTIFRATQALSGEVVFEELLKKLIRIVLENAGAEKGFLLLEDEASQALLIQAECVGNQPIHVLQNQPFEKHAHLSVGIIQFVIRTWETVVLGDAAQQGEFTQDPYVQKQHPKSILCLPILHQGKLIGILYLENNEITEAFTAERLQLLQLLSSQAAISLENARLVTHLEAKVEARTRVLKQRQTQLIQSEKMAGLATVVAGATHELNNPNNFIHFGVELLKAELDGLAGLAMHPADAEILDIRPSLQEKLTTLSSSLNTIQEGSKRVDKIVRGLKTFSRLGEAEYKHVSVVDSLQSVMTLVQANYRSHVKFIENFQMDFQLECWAAELNQAFMNLMINACQAIRTKQSQAEDPAPGQLVISTSQHKDRLVILFQDTGCGMTSEVQAKMFEPFFTTREVGDGNGLGLAIVYSIIEKHRGQIQVESQLGVGTTVSLLLPAIFPFSCR